MTLKFSPTLARDFVPLSEPPTTKSRGGGKKPPKSKLEIAAGGDIPSSSALTGIELRVQELLVADNGTAWIWPFIRYSDLYVVMVSVDNLGGEPYRVSIEGFADIDDGEVLPLERTAYLWQQSAKSPTAPNQVHLVLSVIKSKKGLRNLGKALTTLRSSEDYKTLLGKIAAAAATSGASAIADGALALTGLVGSLLSEVEDVPLLTQALSFTGISGDFDQLGRHVHLKGNKNVSLQVALTVRDANREPKGPTQ
jgi:hypothetical protein